MFKFKQQKTGQTGSGGRKKCWNNGSIKYLKNLWRTFEMPLVNCEINPHLKWSEICISVAGTVANQERKFEITDTKLYVSVVTLSTQDNVKLLKQLESGFERTINLNKYKSKKTNQAEKRYLDFFKE